MSNIISPSLRTCRITTSPSLVSSRLRSHLMNSPAKTRRKRRLKKSQKNLKKMKKNRSNKRTKNRNPLLRLKKKKRKTLVKILWRNYRSQAKTLTSTPWRKEISVQAHKLKVKDVSSEALVIARSRSIYLRTKTSNSFRLNASTRASLMSVLSQYTQLIRSLLSWPRFSRIRPRSTARQPIS